MTTKDEWIEHQRQRLLATRRSREAALASQRARRRQLARDVLVQALGTVLGGLTLALLGVLAGVINGVPGEIVGLAVPVWLLLIIGCAFYMRADKPLEDVALALLEREQSEVRTG